MQPNSPSCANALNRAADQRVRSFEDHVVTRRFPVSRGTAAGPLRGRRAPLRARSGASWARGPNWLVATMDRTAAARVALALNADLIPPT
jgi:hypothetical protein